MARLFISYARVDGKELAERLETDLRRGHVPWRDKSEIEGGDDWSRSIEQAIDGCDALVAVLTQGAHQSHICRCEQQRALRKDKRIVPLLAQKTADRPLYLEGAHYLDFTEPANYDSALVELLDTIQNDKGVGIGDLLPRDRERLPQEVRVRSMAAALRGRQANWDEVRAMAEAQRSRFMEALSPRRGTTGIFEPALYERRTVEEDELDDFLADYARALLVVGDMGTGKTNLLCHWSGERAGKGDAVLVYACERFTGTDVERELVKDLELGDPASLLPTLAYLDELAGKRGRRLIIVYDGLNDFRSGSNDGHRQLLTSIDSLVSRLPGSNLRVVTTCSTAAWNRLERSGPPPVTWARYRRTRKGDETLLLGSFDDKEAAGAFERYRKHFKLPFALSDLAPALSTRLREPLLLRLLADTYRPTADQGDLPPPDTLIFRRYYEERIRRRDDQQFVDALVEEMFARNEAAVSVRALIDHPRLGPAIGSEAADNSYTRLLDQGVLLEVQGDLFSDEVLRFTYPLVAAYALARALAQGKEPADVTLRALLDKADRFPLAWDAAVTLLVMKGVSEGALDLYAQFAGAPSATQRELATDSLARLHEVNRERASQILKGLLDSSSPQQQRTALRAAFAIGPGARDLLLRGAMSASPSLRRAVRDTLYLVWTGASGLPRDRTPGMLYFVWRHAPRFAYELVKDLLARASLVRFREAWRILQFVLDWCVTMYINHCEREEVAQQTAELYYELTVNRFHLNRLFPPQIDRFVANAVAAVVSRPLLEWMLQMTEAEAAEFFRIPVEERKVLAQIAPMLDPAADVAGAEPLIQRMLASRVDVYCGAAALALAVHAYANFASSEAMLRRVFKSLDARGRVWQLMSFAVLLPQTPGSWVPLLEDMTRSLLQTQSEAALGDNSLPKVADLSLVPLGLAYGKQSRGMPLLAELLADTTSRDQDRRRFVMLLSPVGFYYPQAVLDTLKPHLGAFVQRDDLRDALVKVFATMRTLHFDLVDNFMDQAGVGESFRRQVEASTDVSLIDGFMRTLGLFNNAVHQCLFFPRMRRGLSMFPLEKLAEAESARQFIAAHVEQLIRMARDADYRLLKWREPD